MFTFFVVLGCFAALAAIFSGGGRSGSSRREERYITGAEYEPTHHQVLRENILKDR
jgi:hypothetical protein